MRGLILFILICAMTLMPSKAGRSETTANKNVHKHIAGVKYENAKPQQPQKMGAGAVNKSRFDPYKNYKFR